LSRRWDIQSDKGNAWPGGETSLIPTRLRNQKLTSSDLRNPADIVGWLGAVQAQDYTGAKWALGLRSKSLTDDDVEQAFDEGTILRTHVLRPTWHFVTPADIRWMLALTGPRVIAICSSYFRKAELDAAVFSRSRRTLERALRDRNYLTRAELATSLQRAGLPTDGLRLGHLMMRAELDGVVCSGPRRGKQFTYALLEERTPSATVVTRDEALAELTRRYFSSHGPATVADYVWWSGLTVRDVKAGIGMLGSELAETRMAGIAYWLAPSTSRARRSPASTYLLPNFDEYFIASKDRSAAAGVAGTKMLDPASRDSFAHLLVIDGRFAGVWKRTLKADTTLVEVVPYRRVSQAERRAIDSAAKRYGRFRNTPVTVSIS
jgi:hypothetical protein